MQSTIKKENGVLYIAVTGRLDTVTSAELKTALENEGYENVDIDFEVGDDVQILNGPLETFTGKVVAINRAAQKVMVNVSMFGRATDVEVEFFQVKKINVAGAQ